MGKEEKIEKGENNEVTFNEEEQKGKFVVMDEGFNLELEDLLRASAYVVGKSRSGMVYKVVVGRGGTGTAMPTVVAVRRLSEGDAPWKLKEFESEVDAIGRVHHPNIVKLRAYYFAHDEKLLVSDFIRNGSLDSALHGNISLILLVIFMFYLALTFNTGSLHMLQVKHIDVFGHTIFYEHLFVLLPV